MPDCQMLEQTKAGVKAQGMQQILVEWLQDS
jgi:hypothetical protein